MTETILPKNTVRKRRFAVKVCGKNLRKYVPPMRIPEIITPVTNPVMMAFLIDFVIGDVIKYMKYINKFPKIFF
jgi:hypothetical protein